MNNDLSEILDAIDMEWLVQREGMTYRESYGRSGRQLNVKTCPFCGHSEYKVYIGADTGIGSCFSGSCPKKTWNKWSFLKGVFELDGRSLVDLAKALAKEQGWRPTLKAADICMQDLNTLELPDATPAWEMNPLPEYLLRRGVTADVAEYFSLYLCEKGKWNYMNPDGRELSQDYSNRILLPIFDLDGTMKSFQGRDITGTAERRYLFPPGFASAGAYLYGAHNFLAGSDTVVISEGVFDVIQTKRALAAHEQTKDFVPIGSFGMNLSSGNPSGDDQLGRLRQLKQERGLKRVIFLWDGELKAAAAAITASLKCIEIGIRAEVAFVEDGKDPGNSRLTVIQDAVLKAMPVRGKLDALQVLRRSRALYQTA